MFLFRPLGDLHLPVNAPAELLRYLCGMFRRVKTHAFSHTSSNLPLKLHVCETHSVELHIH